jgi:CP family cyanate transporter-like MFS transporter
MGLQSSLFYCVLAWLPPMLRARGLSPVEAGLVASISILVQAPAALVAPALAVRGRDQRLAVAIVVGLAIAGLAGLMFAPTAARWLWTVVLGLGQGAGFAVALTIIVLRSGDAQTAAELSGMSQGIGYSLAAVGPLFMGLLRDWTGGWTWPTVLFFAIALACLSAGLGAGRPLLVRPRPDPRSAPAAA